jgi:hypothetical protein
MREILSGFDSDSDGDDSSVDSYLEELKRKQQLKDAKNLNRSVKFEDSELHKSLEKIESGRPMCNDSCES